MKRVKKSIVSIVLAMVMLLSFCSTTFAMKQYTAQAVDFTIVKDSMQRGVDYPIVVIDNDDKFKVSNGVRLENKWNIEDRVIFKDSTNRLLGIYEVRDNMLVTWKNFN